MIMNIMMIKLIMIYKINMNYGTIIMMMMYINKILKFYHNNII